MSQEREELAHFYDQAIRCEDLEKGESLYRQKYLCRKNGLPCGPKSCPRHPWLVELVTKAEPQAEPESGHIENALVERCPGLGLERPRPVRDRETTTLESEKSIRNEAGLRVLVRKTAKSHSQPHPQGSNNLKRILITFKNRETKVLQRWGFSCIFLLRKRKPSVLEFHGRKGKDARFYFPWEAGNEEIRSVATAWFEKLGIHDSEARVNLMGSPESFNIAILDEVKD